mmetsp:Transcript_16238/g.26398  ORF Transcript_16238/g.26398 Transcript_16238/m.26398 type:complete len:112 (-) Transcript_16238:252-587(-)
MYYIMYYIIMSQNTQQRKITLSFFLVVTTNELSIGISLLYSGTSKLGSTEHCCIIIITANMYREGFIFFHLFLHHHFRPLPRNHHPLLRPAPLLHLMLPPMLLLLPPPHSP